ncbi:hypothetical protein KIN20_007301 [Parelaphostrongylus tenuis]|uniref:Uncharacterized protein n=1 Tax=Parelaphostrongylus tenuis TaxID=148309 RepID=A0AAD5M364_PARTN|nr:hypothetical protein KIN20_007301 [Parelaphostrongylus tenuis]
MFGTEFEAKDDLCVLCLHRLAMSFTMSSRRRWSLRADLLPPPIFREFRFEMAVLDTIFTDINLSALCKSMPFLTTVLCTIYLGWRFQFMCIKSGRPAAFPYLLSMIICCSVLVDVQNGWMVYLVLSGSVLTALLSFPLGVMLYLFYLVRPERLFLLLISFEIGTLASRASYSPLFFALLCQTVFFYSGQSSNISSIDIAVGYKGLSSYSAAFVLFQILMNFYATPIALSLGYSYGKQFEVICRHLLSSTLHLRSLMLLSAITGMICLSGHLFITTNALSKTVDPSSILLLSSISTVLGSEVFPAKQSRKLDD